jgi:ribosomal protein S18 acetylase RimI-like enzyme
MSSEAQGNLVDRLTFAAVAETDFDELVELRIATMRESLERLGRFDPERARERLRKSFYPDESRFIVLAGQRVGFYTFRRADDGLHLDHLYVHPRVQAVGLGSAVLRQLLAQADAAQLPVRLNALRDSAANRFYQRHGFIQSSEDEWDIYYVRSPHLS